MNYLKSSCMFQCFCVDEEYYFRVFKFALKGKFRSILGSDGMMKSDCSLALWLHFECLLNALWVLSNACLMLSECSEKSIKVAQPTYF